MSYRSLLCTSVFALGVTLSWGQSAEAQIRGLGAIDPWGVSYLEADEPAMPTDLWQGADIGGLENLMQRARTHGLTPVERTLLRRAMLSPALKPVGDDGHSLLRQRARILFELGEASAAANLMGQLKESSDTNLRADEISADLQMALGQEAQACSPSNWQGKDGSFWGRLRAVCAALSNDSAGAQIAIELAQMQGVDDDWLFSAVLAATGDLPEGPPARFDTGTNLALSNFAGLDEPVNGVNRRRVDLAAAIAIRRAVSPSLRVRAADIAAEAGLISTDQHRAAYSALLAMEEPVIRGPIESTLATLRSPEADTTAKIVALARALNSSRSSVEKFTSISRLLAPEIDRYNRVRGAGAEGEIFALASLAAGDARKAEMWLTAWKSANRTRPPVILSFNRTTDAAGNVIETPVQEAVEAAELPEPDVFGETYLEGLIALASIHQGRRGGPTRESLQAIAETLNEAAETSAQKDQITDLYLAWASAAMAPPAVRSTLSDIAETRLAPDRSQALFNLQIALAQGAPGEVVLQAIEMINGAPEDLSPVELLLLMRALEVVGAGDAAQMLRLETLEYWKVGGETD